jgi:predicted amidohydrolase
MCTTPRVADNLANAGRLIAQAADRGAGVVMLPEAFAFLGPDVEKRKILEPLNDPDASTPILDWCAETAQRHRLDLIVGGFHEASADPARSYNTCLHLNPAGEIAARYRKIHLFDVALADGTLLQESARTLPGEELVTTPLNFGLLGLSICYDLRFPYLYQRLVDMGAMALSVPSAFTATTGAAHWHVLLRARAIETQCYLFAPAQHGHHHGRRRSYGHSMIIDPWGEVVSELADGDGVVLADIDPERVCQVRSELPSLQHRRQLKEPDMSDSSRRPKSLTPP